jgi:hypothetical protein
MVSVYLACPKGDEGHIYNKATGAISEILQTSLSSGDLGQREWHCVGQPTFRPKNFHYFPPPDRVLLYLKFGRTRWCLHWQSLPAWKDTQLIGLPPNLVDVSRDKVRDDVEGYSEPKPVLQVLELRVEPRRIDLDVAR